MRRLTLLLAFVLAAASLAAASDFRLRRGLRGIGPSVNSPPAWTSSTTLNWLVGASPALQLSAPDPDGGAVTFALKPGSPSLPAGVSLSSGGLLSGAPTAAASGSFQIRASDPQGATADRSFTVTVANPQSCLALFNAGVVASGVYTIDPDGAGSIAALSVYCDQVNDGGGWTLVNKNDKSSNGDRNDAGFNTSALLNPSVNTAAILPRATIAAISPDRTWKLLTSIKNFFSRNSMNFYLTDNHTEAGPFTGEYKYVWTDAWLAQPSHSPIPQHGARIIDQAGLGHVEANRFCCGPPDAGYWIDSTSGGFSGQYIAGSVWVR